MKPGRNTLDKTPESDAGGLVGRHPSILSLGILLVAVTGFFWWASVQELRELESRNRTAVSDTAAKALQLLVDQRTLMIDASPILELRLIRSGLLSPGTAFDRQAVEQLFVEFLAFRPEISQVRWIDATGMERARVNQTFSEEGVRETRIASRLQDKSDRDYFRSALNLKGGDIYISHLDLNQEFGEIALPIEPTLRTAVPTNASLGLRRGVLVINFDLRPVIDKLVETARSNGTALDILDGANGKVYVSSTRPELTWAHQLQSPPLHYGDVYPERFQAIRQFLSTGQPSMQLQSGLVVRADTTGNFRVTDGTLVAFTSVPVAAISAGRRQALGRLWGLAAVALLAGGVLLLRTFRLERKNLEAMHRMRELAAAKSQFLANMSHEIRTPITGILGMLDLAVPEAENPEQKEKLSFIRNSARSLRQVVDDILVVSKLQSAKVELERRVFRPAETLERVARLYAIPARLKGIALDSVVTDTAVEVEVSGDEFRLEQVLNNLVDNAIKFTESGTISLRMQELRRRQDRVILRFSVRDSGIGIAPGAIDQLCQPFVQADSSTTRKHGGTGLGLSICNNLLSLMGSELRIASELGAGSEFSFDLELPLADGEPDHLPRREPAGAVIAPQAATPSPQAGKACPDSADAGLPAAESPEAQRERLTQALKQAVALHGPPRVLVTEDSIAMQVLLKALFESLDIPITVAENGQEALELIDAHPFDLVFMDLQMPVMGGAEAISIIRERFTPQQLPIIVLSAATGGDETVEEMAAGSDHFLAKPIDMVELLNTLLRFWTPGAGAPG